MGEPTFWMKLNDFLDTMKHKILCLLGKHYPPINLDGQPDNFCWYCEKEE